MLACSCSRAWNDSFKLIAKKSEFVALVKILSFDEYLERGIIDYDEKMPFSMTVEVIQKYKGEEKRKKIKIWGDDGMLCRPYLSDFKINSYYLIAPNPLDNASKTDYDFFSCRTDYLKVDMSTKKAYGKYSLIRHQIDISDFERKLKNGDWDLILIISVLFLVILCLIILQKYRKQMQILLLPANRKKYID